MAKGVIDAAARPALAATLDREIAIQEICVQSDDFAEGLRAVAERRAPRFGGR
jgi:enoyl-CoA hydratase/carnithine racemase